MFRDRLRVLREQAPMSQAELAAKLNVHPVCISNWEVGKRRPSVDDLTAIAEALGVHPAQLVSEAAEADLISSVVSFLRSHRTLTPTGTDGGDGQSDARTNSQVTAHPDWALVAV